MRVGTAGGVLAPVSANRLKREAPFFTTCVCTTHTATPPQKPTSQGAIYLMLDDEGKDRKDVLLKVLHANAVLGDLEKEWLIGQVC